MARSQNHIGLCSTRAGRLCRPTPKMLFHQIEALNKPCRQFERTVCDRWTFQAIDGCSTLCEEHAVVNVKSSKAIQHGWSTHATQSWHGRPDWMSHMMILLFPLRMKDYWTTFRHAHIYASMPVNERLWYRCVDGCSAHIISYFPRLFLLQETIIRKMASWCFLSSCYNILLTLNDRSMSPI